MRKPDEEYPEPKEIPKCGKSCPLEQFFSIYADLLPGQFDVECGTNEGTKIFITRYFILFTVILAVFFR